MSLLISMGLFLFVIVVTELVVHFLGRNNGFKAPDLIVVLGCGNRVHRPLLRDRLEMAIKAHQEFPHIPILLTGDEKNKAEISSMMKYMKEKLPQASLLADPNSLKTWDSFLYIKKNFSNAKLLVKTNEFHQKGSLLFGKLLNLLANTYCQDWDFTQDMFMFVRERLARLFI